MWRFSLLVCQTYILVAFSLPSLPPYLTDFQGSYPEDFNSFLRTAKRYHNDKDQSAAPSSHNHGHGKLYMGENPQNEGDLRERFRLVNDLNDLYPRSEYANPNILKSLTGEEMKVTGKKKQA